MSSLKPEEGSHAVDHDTNSGVSEATRPPRTSSPVMAGMYVPGDSLLGHVFEKIRLKCHKHLNRRKVAPLPLSFGISRDGCTAGQVNGAIASTHVCLR
jgi:hypothetical protein